MEHFDDDDLGSPLGTTLPPSRIADDDDDIWDTTDDKVEEPIPDVAQALETPIGETFSPIALQGVSTRQKKKTLSAQSNEWLQLTFTRLSGLLEANPDALEALDWKLDIDYLKAAAAARGRTLVHVDVPLPGEPVKRVEVSASGVVTQASIVPVRLTDIEPDPAQARDEGADEELAGSIRANGVLQPIELRRTPTAFAKPFMIVDGERRYRGAIAAGLEFIPATVTESAENEGDRLIRQVVRNDGKRLKPMEEARTYKRIMAAKGFNLQQLAEHLGKSKSTVSDRVALADAPPAFQPLFESGELTAAAAPVVRKFADVPVKQLESMLEYSREDSQWESAARDGKPVPLKVVERCLWEAADEVLELVRADVYPRFTGAKVKLDDQWYAIDRPAYQKVEAQVDEEKARAAAKSGTSTPKAEKRGPDRYQLAERKKAKERKKKMELRHAQVRAIAPKLPATLDAKWSLFLVRHLIDEITNDTAREACKLLNLTPVKSGQYGGFTFDKTLTKHAESLKGPELVPMALKILLASDLSVPTYSNAGPRRIPAAAELAKVDLKKVKVTEATAATSTKPAFNGPTGPVNKKKGARAFMAPFRVSDQLSAVIGAGPMVRTEVTKKLWGYIKRNNLQDPKERRMIVADDKLRPVFGGKKRVSMFEMTKLINKHLK